MATTRLATAILASMPKPLIFPAITEHRSTVIIAHGFGDSGHGYVPIVRNWQESGLFQDTKFILPSAPSINVASASGRSIPSWFDIRGERGPHVTFDTLTRQNNDEAGMLRSRDFFLSLLHDEIEGERGIPASRVVMGGFSQGSVMALLTGLTGDLQMGGVFCLCGYLPLADAVRESGQGGGPVKFPHVKEGTDMEVLMINGEKDPIMNLEWVGKSRDIVKELGYPVESSVIAGLGHSINEEVLTKVAAFIKRIQDKGKDQHDEL